MPKRCSPIVIDRPRLPLRTLTGTLDGSWTTTPPQQVRDVSIDSRRVRNGSLFVALEGTETHGHEYLNDAAGNGATGAIVESPQESSLPEFVVEDSARALQKLSRRYRQSFTSAYRIGVTGTAGKTTLKTMLSRILTHNYRTGRTDGNFNNHLGLPLTLLNQGHGEILVAELATSGPGEIGTLSRWLRPHLGIITHVGAGHLEGLGSVRAVAEEKADLFGAVESGGLAVAPADVRHRDVLEERSSVRPFFVENGMTHPVELEWSTGRASTRLVLNGTEVQLPFTGEGLVVDAALASFAGVMLGVEESTVKEELESFRPLGGRGRVLTVEGCDVIDGTYNANPDSVRTAIERLAKRPEPRLVVLGDMKELGDVGEEFHREVGRRLGELEETDLIVVGEYADVVEEAAGAGPESVRTVPAVEKLDGIPFAEYESALLKASRSVGLDRLLPEVDEDS